MLNQCNLELVQNDRRTKFSKVSTHKYMKYLSLSFYNATHGSTKLLLYPFKSNNICILNSVMQ